MDGYCTDIFTQAANRCMANRRHRPFFTYLAYNAPHAPLQAWESDAWPYRVKGLRDDIARLYGMVTHLDENIGKLLGTLKTMGLDQNTIVIFMSDNGPDRPRYNAGMRGLKGSVYEGGLRVPCFIRWPGRLQAGRKVGNLSAHIDIVPTLLEACGVAVPKQVKLDGASLMPLLRRERVNWADRRLYFQWHRGDQPVEFRNAAAVSQRYKLVEGRELYDRVSDPGEQNDIAAAHPEIVAAMRQGYQEWFRDVSSTRGYAPPRIQLGTPHEDPTTLTRQDWRGPRAGWKPDDLGYWEVQVAHAGNYMVGFRFTARATSGEARLRIGGVEKKERVFTSATSCGFDTVRLKAGPTRLEAILELGGKSVGVDYVDVLRVK